MDPAAVQGRWQVLRKVSTCWLQQLFVNLQATELSAEFVFERVKEAYRFQ